MASEQEGLLQQKETYIQKLNYLRKELAIASDVSVKFTLQMQIRELEEEIEAVNKRIEALKEQFNNTQKNMEVQIEQKQESIDNFSDKIDLAKRFIENGEISQAIQVMKQTSNSLEDELMLLNSRLHMYQQFYNARQIDHHGLAHEKGIINAKLIEILKKLKI